MDEMLFDLNNEKYQIPIEDAVTTLEQNDFRVIQLPTVAKLTTDNVSVCKDFPIREIIKMGTGVVPYSKYVIRVKDTYEVELNIVVHQYSEYALLCPIVLGFKTGNPCSYLNLTENWRIRDLQLQDKMPILPDGSSFNLNNIHFKNIKTAYLDRTYVSTEFSSDFSNDTRVPILKVYTAGIFNQAYNVLQQKPKINLFERWLDSSDYTNMQNMAAPSSASLVLQIFLYTLLIWKKRCNERKVILRTACNNAKSNEKTLDGDLRTYQSSNKYIVDINKDIIIYENKGMTSRQFSGYHMTMTLRCGHFRHYKSGQIIYIPPTTVHFKKILPNAFNGINRKILYRNTEDFLREKSYLESDVCIKLKQKGIRFEREKTFNWLGRKRLDFYLPDYNIVIECQGVQHFYRYGLKDNDFEERVRRDKEKFAECETNNLHVLYYMNENIPLPDFIDNCDRYYTNLNDLMSFMK